MSVVDPQLRVDEFDYDLPASLIAQAPLAERDASRLMLVERNTGSISHRSVRDLPSLLRDGDLVVVNNTRVFAGRLIGRRATGGRVELLLLRRGDPGWTALAKPAKRIRDNETVELIPSANRLAGRFTATIVRHDTDGLVEVELSPDAEAQLDEVGTVPLPPYIRERLGNRERYQTVFATEPGSAAAPTAGLHLTPRLIDDLRGQGVDVGVATLHVGLETFRPVSAERVSDHVIHREWCEVSPALGRQISLAKERGGRVVAIGTTTARTLETLGGKTSGDLDAGWSGWTDIFITPGYRWGVVDGLLTNFHLPRSTLLMMVSAFGGVDLIGRAYATAISEEYRFFSFGDAMLIL